MPIIAIIVLNQASAQRLNDSLKKSEAQRKQRDESLQSTITNDVSRAVKDTVGNTLRSEIKQTVNPGLFHMCVLTVKILLKLINWLIEFYCFVF